MDKIGKSYKDTSNTHKILSLKFPKLQPSWNGNSIIYIYIKKRVRQSEFENPKSLFCETEEA